MTRDTDADGGVPMNVDHEELYSIVRAAVKDAIRDVLGTISLLAFSLVFLAVGLRVFLTETSSIGIATGITIIGIAILLAAAALNFVPPFKR